MSRGVKKNVKRSEPFTGSKVAFSSPYVIL